MRKGMVGRTVKAGRPDSYSVHKYHRIGIGSARSGTDTYTPSHSRRLGAEAEAESYRLVLEWRLHTSVVHTVRVDETDRRDGWISSGLTACAVWLQNARFRLASVPVPKSTGQDRAKAAATDSKEPPGQQTA